MSQALAYTFAPLDVEAVDALTRELGVSRAMSEVLARRGLGDPVEARRFLSLDGPQHPPVGLGHIDEASALIASAVSGGRRIVVHGDYDCDGIAATVLLVAALEELGGTAEAFLPSRFAEGYGLAVETVERLAESGCEVLITVDCGITAVEAVARARALGLQVVVSDHHRPGAELPDCPLVTPRTGDPTRDLYPFPELCGAGVAYKLAGAVAARLGAGPGVADRHLDLVALATVADLVPLVGENRGLVRAGLRAIARGGRVGLAALCEVAGIDRSRLDASSLGFRLAPRINAAGRLGHPDTAYRLLRATGRPEALVLARELDELSRQRQAIEARILAEALAQAAALPPELRDARGVVLASDTWHPGVIGIVASRVVERLGKPAVLIAIDETSRIGTGSGRSLPAFDLHGALAACAQLLDRWGGHRQAAGLTIAADRVDELRSAFAEHANTTITSDDLHPRPRVDLVLGVTDVSLALADELARLGPFGLGNPAITVLVPGARLGVIETLGQGKAHLRLGVEARGASCRTLWWRAAGERGRLLAAGAVDVLCSVERNDFNGSSAVQLVARAVHELPTAPAQVAGCSSRCDASCPARRLPGGRSDLPLEPASPVAERSRRRAVPVRDGPALAASLLAAGERVLVLVSDVSTRRALLGDALEPGRLGVDAVVLASRRCEVGALAARLAALPAGKPTLVVADWESAVAWSLDRSFAHVVAVDPPTNGAERRLLERCRHGYEGWAERRSPSAIPLESQDPERVARAVWRAVGGEGATLPAIGETTGGLPHPPSAEDLERALGILVEAGMVVTDGELYARAPAPPRVAFADLPEGARWVGEHAARVRFASGARAVPAGR